MINHIRRLLPFTKKARRSQALLPIVLVCLLVIMTLLAAYYKYQLVRQVASTHSYVSRLWQTGDIIQDDRFSFRLSSLSASTQAIPGVWELPVHTKFVIATMSFKNNSNVPYNLSPVSAMSIRAEDSTLYGVSSAPIIQQSLGGEVQPMQTVTGEVGFIVPDSFQHGILIFSPGLSGAGQIIVATSL